MKYLLSICFTAAVVTAGSAQDIPQSEVPSLVLNAFHSTFSDATDVEWEKEADLFKVEFEIGNRDHDLWLDKNGIVKKHKEEIENGELPEAVKQKLKSDFKEYRVDDVDKIETDGKVYFRVDLDSNSGDRDVLFLADGSVQQTIE